MWARRHLIFIALVLLTVVAHPCVLFAQDGGFTQSDEPEPAPRFHARTLSGETYTNASVKGKVVLLEFWTTWCPYCKDEEALVDAVDHEFSGKGLLVLAIDVGESKQTVQKYLEQHPRSCRIVLMRDTNLAAMYQANSYPIYVVIDREGNIAAEQRGAGGEKSLRGLLRRAGVGKDDEVLEKDQ
ncbi:MAG TPA: TlpA disulfide reductase family protein [Terriglobales bacterium]|jgi:thiol-disulfide isomerase/thioredoxin|nr:TlpA disulfide reductase family protein [Terriglobales bacterium]